MYDFLKYILQVSKNSIGVGTLAVIVGLAGLITGCSAFHKKHNGRGHFPWEKDFLWLVFAGYIAVIVSVTLLRQGEDINPGICICSVHGERLGITTL